jgi:ribosomal protein S27AE
MPTILPPYDGSMPIDVWKSIRAREMKMLAADESSLLKATDAAGIALYKVNSGGNIVRTRPVSKSTRRKVVERDKTCVECGSGPPFEVHHITRYIDGGSNQMDNLQTLCEPCHKSKGGR